MPRRSASSTSLLAQVRQWFGLTQAELALYLGSSQTRLQALEAGPGRLGVPLVTALLPLARHLPPPPAAPGSAETLAPMAPPAPVAAPPAALSEAPDAAALDFRRRQCLAQATRLAAELAKLEAAATAAARWAAALPALLAEAPPPIPGSTPAEAAAREGWRQGWLARRARPRPAAEATRAALLRARLAGLQAEAAALAVS